MRRTTDLPRHRSRLRASGRVLIIGVAAFFLLVVVLGRALARFYIDALWFEGLGQSSVFWRAIGAKFTLFGIFFAVFVVIAGLNVALADRLAPRRFPTTSHPAVEWFHEAFGPRLRAYRYAAIGVLAFLMALPATAQWRSWLLFRNSQRFGTADAQFDVDVGFYVFELPFLSFVLDWLFFALIVVLLVTLATHVLNGAVAFASPIPSVNASARGHLAVLLAVLAAVKAADYWVRRYESTNETRGFVQGATYAVVNAQLPALLLLALVALITSALFLSTLRTESWRLPLIASALWLVLAIFGGYVYPAAIQGLVVNPGQQSREETYIRRNVFATREAMGIAPGQEVRYESVSFDRLTADSIVGDLEPLQDVRLLNPVEMRSRFEIDRGEEAGLTIADLDVDRYEIDGEVEQVVVAARELDLAGVPNRSWQGLHLINTRGCGLVRAPASRVQVSGRPVYEFIDLDRPELYFSPSLSGYAVAGTTVRERECEGGSGEYTGTAGVAMSSFLRRAAFGLAFMDYNVVVSGEIQPDSQMLWVRDVRSRVEKLAPFLSFDGDPYPVAVDGRVLWVIDGYTSTSRYPYAQQVGNDVQLTPGSGIPRDANYVRNSVKAVVDAYDGSVTMYVIEPDDPIVRAWSSAFPTLFTSAEEMPEGLAEHLRYPEDLFRIQTDLYSKYQLAPERFFERDGAWSVAQNPGFRPRIGGSGVSAAAPAGPVDESSAFATEASTNRFTPYYTMWGEGDDRSFVLLRPFVPFSRDDQRRALNAFMTASSDPDTYGELTVYVLDEEVNGPLSVANAVESQPAISREITLQNNPESGTEVRFGDLQLVPVGDGLLWVRPFYVARQQEGANVQSVTEYRFMIVSDGDDSVYDTTIGGALGQLYPGLEVDIGERSNTRVEATGEVDDPSAQPALPVEPEPDGVDEEGAEPDDTIPSAPALAGTPGELLTEADELLRQAEQQLRLDGDLGAYQDRVNEAGALVSEALDQLTDGPADEIPDETD